MYHRGKGGAFRRTIQLRSKRKNAKRQEDIDERLTIRTAVSGTRERGISAVLGKPRRRGSGRKKAVGGGEEGRLSLMYTGRKKGPWRVNEIRTIAGNKLGRGARHGVRKKALSVAKGNQWSGQESHHSVLELDFVQKAKKGGKTKKKVGEGKVTQERERVLITQRKGRRIGGKRGENISRELI